MNLAMSNNDRPSEASQEVEEGGLADITNPGS